MKIEEQKELQAKVLKRIMLRADSPAGAWYKLQIMEIPGGYVIEKRVCEASPVDSPHYIVQQFKGVTSWTLRLGFPGIKKKVPTLWTRSYYCESIGHISVEIVQRYIEDQKNQ